MNVRHRQCLAANQQLAQPGEQRGVVVDHGIEQRCGQPGSVNCVPLDRAGQSGARGQGFVVDHADTAVEQRPPDFQRRSIEAQRRCMQQGIADAQFDIADIDHQPQDRPMADLDPLGLAGRARGVHHVGDRIAVDRDRGERRQGRRTGGGFTRHQHREAGGYTVAPGGCRHHQPDACVGQHEANARHRKIRLHRHIDCARLQNGEQCHDGFGRTVEHHADSVACLNAVPLQLPCDVVGLLVQFLVADVPMALHQRGSVAALAGRFDEPPVHRALEVVNRQRRVPGLQLPKAVMSGEGANVVQQRVGSGRQVGGGIGHGFEQALCRCGIEQAGRRIQAQAPGVAVEADAKHIDQSRVRVDSTFVVGRGHCPE